MWDQEKRHLAKFNEILADHRVRPTMLLPLWNISGYLLGVHHMVSLSPPPPPLPTCMSTSHSHISHVWLISHTETTKSTNRIAHIQIEVTAGRDVVHVMMNCPPHYVSFKGCVPSRILFLFFLHTVCIQLGRMLRSNTHTTNYLVCQKDI